MSGTKDSINFYNTVENYFAVQKNTKFQIFTIVYIGTYLPEKEKVLPQDAQVLKLKPEYE